MRYLKMAVLNKYFIAIIPPPPIDSQILEMKKGVAEKYFSYGALRSPAHITLHMPFNLEKNKERKFLEAIESWRPNIPSFKVELSDFSCFEPRVIFVNVKDNPELNSLQVIVVDFMRGHFNIFNQAEDMRGFHPHITVAFRDLKKQFFYQAWNEFSVMKYKSSFDCCSFCVLRWEENNWNVIKEIVFNTAQ